MSKILVFGFILVVLFTGVGIGFIFDDNELVYEDCIKKTEQACEIAIRNVCNESKNIDISLALSNKSIIT